MELLEWLGQPVHSHFATAEEAMSALRDSAPEDLVLLTDYSLPGIKAPEFIAQVRSWPCASNWSVVLMTGFLWEDIAHEFTHQPDHFLAKPFSVEALTALLEPRA